MATLKEHRAAMVDLLANGSGIPASASRLAHAMHDVLEMLLSEREVERCGALIDRLIVERGEGGLPEHPFLKRNDVTTPGLNDKALSKRERALKTDSHAKWPTPAEQRVKELENTCTQLRKQSARYRATIAGQKEHIEHLQFELETLRVLPEQDGCRKEDTQSPQECLHLCTATYDAETLRCDNCGAEIPE